jgi:hypothetical protein
MERDDPSPQRPDVPFQTPPVRNDPQPSQPTPREPLDPPNPAPLKKNG